MGLCVSKREEDEALIRLLGGCKQWRLTWLNIIASNLDRQGFVHLANVLENGRCTMESLLSLKVFFPIVLRLEHLDAKREVLQRGSMVSLRKLWRSTKTSWRVGRSAALKLTPVESPDEGWKTVPAQILSLLFSTVKPRLRIFCWGAGSVQERQMQPCNRLLPQGGQPATEM